MLENSFDSVVRADRECDDSACCPAMGVAADRSWECGISDDAIRLTDTALVETGDVTNRPDFGDCLGCCGGMCCCHRPDREEPGHHGIQPCDAQTGLFIGFHSIHRDLL